MKYLLDSDIINILYDDSRKGLHEKIHEKISRFSDEDELRDECMS